MASNIDLIKTTLPQDLRDMAQRFTIADNFLSSIPDVITLILRSKSMDTDQEKQSWFSLLPMMNEEQMNKLKDILIREKQKLDDIEHKYAQKKQDLQTKYAQNFEAVVYTKHMNDLKQKEAAHEEIEDKQAEDLLNQI